jgi:hypothetical protein
VAEEVKTTLSPLQNVTGPAGEIVGGVGHWAKSPVPDVMKKRQMNTLRNLSSLMKGDLRILALCTKSLMPESLV